MSEKKSDKELAFLKDLYVATGWGERFAALVDGNVSLPKKGRILYVEAGTGNHAMALQERAEDEVRLVCVDESEECLELARVKAMTIREEPEFHLAQPDALWFRDEQFDLVIGDGSLIAPERLKQMLSELVRVAMPGGRVAFSLVTAASFGEFFSVYWEALRNAGLEEMGASVEERILELPTIAHIEEMAAAAGLDKVTSRTTSEEFDYESGEEFLNSPLITDFLMRGWLRSLPEEKREIVLGEIARVIDAERKELDFTLTVKATLVVGRKK